MVRPIEIESSDGYVSCCPNCGCTIYFGEINDIASMVESTTVYEGINWIEDLECYDDIYEKTAYYIHPDWHDCGCDCWWWDDDDLSRDLKNGSEAHEVSASYECAECSSRYARFTAAKECCKVENLTPELVYAKLKRQ